MKVVHLLTQRHSERVVWLIGNCTSFTIPNQLHYATLFGYYIAERTGQYCSAF